jgi:YcaO cyclodehydratase, ATP-ad Mg2+-binding
MPRRTFPLPEGWSAPEFVEDIFIADGIELYRAGISSIAPNGEELTGAAVEAETSPLDRAYFELLERVSTIEALTSGSASYDLLDLDGDVIGERAAGDIFPESNEPARWRYARSNGIALHVDWRRASLRAFWEMSERTRVLHSWYGATRPVRLDFRKDSTPLRRSESYEWRAYLFPASNATAFSCDVEVVGVYGLPRRAAVPLVLGYGAHPERDDALNAGLREAMQLLGFLWGEPTCERLPQPAPTPLHHLEHYQWPGHRDVLQAWLDDGHERFWQGPLLRAAGARERTSRSPGVAFVDLTPSWLRGGLRVAKAVCDDALPLVFGETPFASHLPPPLRVHPIA